MKKILLLITISIGLSAQADYTVQTQQPLYPIQGVNYSTTQPYEQSYGLPYGQQYNQNYYQNPYQTQCQGQYVNPYQYRNPYGYGNSMPYSVVNSAVNGLGGTGSSSVVRNIGQSMLFSLLRGY